MNNHGKEALSLFRQGYNCSQSVFAAYAEDFGISRLQALRLSASFGGGIGRMRETCGAFSGAAMVLGLVTGSTEGADTAGKQRNYAAVQEFALRFRQANGSLCCRELLGLDSNADVSDTQPAPRTADYYALRPCPRIVETTCDLLDAFLEELHQSEVF